MREQGETSTPRRLPAAVIIGVHRKNVNEFINYSTDFIGGKESGGKTVGSLCEGPTVINNVARSCSDILSSFLHKHTHYPLTHHHTVVLCSLSLLCTVISVMYVHVQ